MNRRLLLASIATVAASRVAAQTPAPQQVPAQTIAPPAPEGGLSDAQQKHLHDTMAVGSLSLLLSRIALPKADNPLLKQFVEFEIAEQETVADVLKSIQTNAPTGSIKAPSDQELMQSLDDVGKAAVEKLRGLRAGSEFDHDYVQYEVEGHRKLLDTQELYLKVHDNLDQTNVAKLVHGMIKEHLTLLTGVQKVG
jgi:putative membrane protein